MKPRARTIGIPFDGVTGLNNAITDVPGVEVGYVTRKEGSQIRTGVTAICPRGRTKIGIASAAGFYSLNGNGEMTGAIWIHETGSLSMPIMITNTHAVGHVHRGVIDWIAKEKPALASQWLLPVVTETWDGILNDINLKTISEIDAINALNSAISGAIEEGSVGGGTGMNCYEYSGGSGTSSRKVKYAGADFVVGAFVQSNFGSRDELVIAGVSMQDSKVPNLLTIKSSASANMPINQTPPGAGSVIVIIGTDAPLLPLQCKALARRVPLGLARTGTTGSHFSGDIFLAFSTANEGALQSKFPDTNQPNENFDTFQAVPWGEMDRFYEAVVQAVEEAVINSIIVNEDVLGQYGRQSSAIPHEFIINRLKKANRI